MQIGFYDLCSFHIDAPSLSSKVGMAISNHVDYSILE